MGRLLRPASSTESIVGSCRRESIQTFGEPANLLGFPVVDSGHEGLEIQQWRTIHDVDVLDLEGGAGDSDQTDNGEDRRSSSSPECATGNRSLMLLRDLFGLLRNAINWPQCTPDRERIRLPRRAAPQAASDRQQYR